MPRGDSISRYDSSMEMFTAKATPIQMKKAQGASGKDTLETPKARMERLNPFKTFPSDSRVSGDRIVKIARAGRFVFFAIALPPYLLMYSLPKWVALTVLPTLLVPVEKSVKYAKQLMQKIIKALVAGNFPFRNILGRISWKAKGVEKQQPSLLSYLKQSGVKISDAIQTIVAKTYKTLKKAVTQTVAKVFVQPVVVVKEKVRAVVKEAQKILETAVEKVTERVASVATSINEATVLPVVNFMVPKVKVAQHTVERGFKWAAANVKQFVKVVTETILPPLKVVHKAAKAMQEAVSTKVAEVTQQLVQVAQPAINLFVPTLQFLKKHLSFGLRWSREKPKQLLWNLHFKVQKFLKNVVPFIDDAVDKAHKKARNTIDWLAGPFLRLLEKWFPFIPWILRKIRAILNLLLTMVKRKIVAALDFIVEQAKKLLEAPKSYLLGLVRKILGLGAKVFKLAALVFVGAGLVFKYWVLMLYELGDEMGTWGSRKSSP